MTTDKNSLFTVITEEESATVAGGISADLASGSASGYTSAGSVNILSNGKVFLLSLNTSDVGQFLAFLDANPDVKRSLEAAK